MLLRRHIAPAVLAWCACVALLVGCRSQQPADDRSQASPLVGLSPSGPSRLPLHFTWRGGASDQVVRIMVVDEAERLLMQFDARGEQASLPAGYEQGVPRGETLAWRIAPILDGGELGPASAFVQFSVPAE